MGNLLKVAMLASLLVGGVARAERSNTMSENRGFATCVAAAQAQARSAKISPRFFVNSYADSHQFYLNGYANVEGKWGPIRVRCQTDRKGYRVLALQLQEGKFAPRFLESVAQH